MNIYIFSLSGFFSFSLARSQVGCISFSRWWVECLYVLMLFFLASFFLSFFFLLLLILVLVELSFSIIFFLSYCFLFSSLHCLCFIIAIRQPSPNKRLHETRKVLFFFLGCYWCSITNFSLFLHVRTSLPLLTLWIRTEKVN